MVQKPFPDVRSNDLVREVDLHYLSSCKMFVWLFLAPFDCVNSETPQLWLERTQLLELSDLLNSIGILLV